MQGLLLMLAFDLVGFAIIMVPFFCGLEVRPAWAPYVGASVVFFLGAFVALRTRSLIGK